MTQMYFTAYFDNCDGIHEALLNLIWIAEI